MKPYSCCRNSIPTFPRLSRMSLKPSNGSEHDGSDMEPGTSLEKDFTAVLNIYSTARMLRPSTPHQGNRNRGSLDPCNPDHAGQGQHSPEQREAHAEPNRRNTNFTVHLHHSLMQQHPAMMFHPCPIQPHLLLQLSCPFP